jgi:hypothetical protein
MLGVGTGSYIKMTDEVVFSKGNSGAIGFLAACPLLVRDLYWSPLHGVTVFALSAPY